MRAPRSVGLMGDIVSRDLRGGGHLWLRKGMSGLNHTIIIGVNEIAFGQLLAMVDMCRNV